jgi:hypothetical protein
MRLKEKANSSDLSMNWALQKPSFQRTSIYTAVSNDYLKSRPYVCEDCHQNNHELLVIPAAYQPNPYYRKKAGKSHSPHCKYRNLQSYIETVAGQYKIQLQGQLILFDSLRLLNAWNYGSYRSEYADFLRNPHTASLAYFLGHMAKELELLSLRRHYRGYHLVSKSSQYKIALDQLIGYQDDIIKEVGKTPLRKCLAFIVGRIDRIERNDEKEYILIHFQVAPQIDNENSAGNTQAFRLFVPRDYREIVGDLDDLSGRFIGCFGIAEKKEFGNIYQMTLFSVLSQVVHLDLDHISNLPEGLDSIPEPRLETNQIPQEITRFVGHVWAGVPLNEQQASAFFQFYYEDWFDRLKQQKPHIEHEKKAYHDYLDQQNNVLYELNSLEGMQQQLLSSYEEKSRDFKKHDTLINRQLMKWGWSQKLQLLKDDLDSAMTKLELSEREKGQLLKEKETLLASEPAWEKRKKDVDGFESQYPKIEKLVSFEQECKAPLGSDFLFFKLPLQHSYWDLLITIYVTEVQEAVTLHARVQLYRVHENNWLPLDHPNQLGAMVTEAMVDEKQVTKKQLHSLFSKVGEGIKQSLLLLGYSKQRLECPRCGKATRISFNKDEKSLEITCWDRQCQGRSPIQFE